MTAAVRRRQQLGGQPRLNNSSSSSNNSSLGLQLASKVGGRRSPRHLAAGPRLQQVPAVAGSVLPPKDSRACARSQHRAVGAVVNTVEGVVANADCVCVCVRAPCAMAYMPLNEHCSDHHCKCAAVVQEFICKT